MVIKFKRLLKQRIIYLIAQIEFDINERLKMNRHGHQKWTIAQKFPCMQISNPRRAHFSIEDSLTLDYVKIAGIAFASAARFIRNRRNAVSPHRTDESWYRYNSDRAFVTRSAYPRNRLKDR